MLSEIACVCKLEGESNVPSCSLDLNPCVKSAGSSQVWLHVLAALHDWSELVPMGRPPAARQSPQHGIFRRERASPSSTPSSFVPFHWCGCWCLVRHWKCMLMQLHVIYHLLSGHRPFSFCPLLSPSMAPTPTSLRLTDWLYTCIMWRWCWASCRVRLSHLLHLVNGVIPAQRQKVVWSFHPDTEEKALCGNIICLLCRLGQILPLLAACVCARLRANPAEQLWEIFWEINRSSCNYGCWSAGLSDAQVNLNKQKFWQILTLPCSK